MLTRPGSPQGSGWMRDLSERLACSPTDPAGVRSMPRGYWLIYIALMILMIAVVPRALQRAGSPRETSMRKSSIQIAGLPLYASGGSPVAIIAIGARPRGLIAIGGVTMGMVAVGGVAVGAFAFGAISVGLMAIGLAIGWWAMGGGAIGYRSFGGLACGGYAYAGNGVAYGFYEASGRQKERLLG